MPFVPLTEINLSFFEPMAAPLPPLVLLTTGLVVAAWAWSVRTLWRRSMPAVKAAPIATQRLVRWLPRLSVLLLAVACSYPGHRPIDWLVWLPWAFEIYRETDQFAIESHFKSFRCIIYVPFSYLLKGRYVLFNAHHILHD